MADLPRCCNATWWLRLIIRRCAATGVHSGWSARRGYVDLRTTGARARAERGAGRAAGLGPVTGSSAPTIADYTIRARLDTSEKWFPYPYPTAINVSGPVIGMEYPMIVFCSERGSYDDVFDLTAHEVGHQWFPMMVGSNERLYTWMDEAFSSFLHVYSGRAFFPDQPLRFFGQGAHWAQIARTGLDEPIMLSADRIQLRMQAERTKPAVGLYLLRHVVLDSARFDAAFREYIRRWAFKHPEPADFFRTIEDVTGEDLAWFWRGWFYRTDVVDLAVDSVTVQARRGARYTRIVLTSPAGSRCR